METIEIVAKEIKRGLDQNKKTQKELANLLGVTEQAVSKWVNSLSLPGEEYRHSIDLFLNTNISEILKDRSRMTIRKKIQINTETNINDLNTIEKARDKCKEIMIKNEIDKYSRAVYIMIEWLIVSTIGLTYHWHIHKKRKDDETIYDDVFFYLNEIVQYRGGEALKDFEIMQFDIWESFGDYKLTNHDYANDCMELWNKFKMVYDFNDESDLNREFRIAVLDILSNESCY